MFLKKISLPAVVFLTGAAVLVLEVTATRALSPYFGNTIYAVSSVIGVILAALSLGYYLGGRLADSRPRADWFYGIILLSGLSVILLELIAELGLPLLGVSLSLTSGPLISALILFFLPALLLGTLSPYAIKLQSLAFPAAGLGAVSGLIFFWSTLGSIAGSLITGFVLIPNFGVDKIILGTGLILVFIGLAPSGLKRPFKSLIVLAAVIVLAGAELAILNLERTGLVYSADGVYEKLTIFDGEYLGRPARFFQQDRSSSGAMYLDSDQLIYDYTKYYELYKIFKPETERALVIGGGAYSLPKALLKIPGIKTVDVAEIEPSLINLARKYFRLPADSRLSNYVTDGRRRLNDQTAGYDLIFSDVYYSLYSIPAQFTTTEFFSLAKSRLSPNGIFLANLIGRLDERPPSLIMSEIKTFKTAFPSSYFFAVRSPADAEPQNIIFLGVNNDLAVDLKAQKVKNNPDPIIAGAGQHLIDLSGVNFDAFALLTDNYAPVEYLTAKVLN